jgi:hypothetical protein
MTTHVNKVHHVTTINRVAQDLGIDEDWLWDVANEMEIEDGHLGSMAWEKMASKRSPTSESKT